MAKLLRIIPNVSLEPVLLPFLRFWNLKCWNNSLYMPQLRTRVRIDDPRNLVLKAGARDRPRALAGNVSSNLSLVA